MASDERPAGLGWVEKYAAVIYSVLLVFAVAAVVGMVLVARHFSLENQQRIAEIQQERQFAARTTCVDINLRHDETIRRLNKRIDAAVAARPGQERRIRESQAYTRLLIDALVPLRDCDLYVNKIVNPENTGG